MAPLITPPVQRVLPPPQPEIVPLPAPTVEAPEAPPVGPPVRVDQVRVEGVTVYDDAALRALHGDLVGVDVPRARLDEAVQTLQTRYREDGYILTLVRGEFQRTTEGQVVFVIRAIEGYISDVKLDGDIGPAGTLVLDMLQRLTGKRPVNNRDLERYLLLANDIPGITARAILRREGLEPGAVLLVAQVARKEVTGLLSFDNRGPREAGPYQLLLSGATQSYTSFGERAEALFFNTFNREQIFGQINLSGFLNGEGLRLRSYYGRGNSIPGGILAPLNFNSDLEIGGVALSYPFVRSRRFNVFSDVAIDTYHSKLTLSPAGDVETRAGSDLWIGRLGGIVDFQDSWFLGRPAATALSVRLSNGFLGTSSIRLGSDAHFLKTNGEITRVQDLFSIGNVQTALKTSVGGQYTTEILPPSEKFFLGGTRFGRGFYYGQVTGDRAIGSSVELQFNTRFSDLPLVNPDYQLPVQFYGFWDYGRGFNVPKSGDPDFTVQSLGVGARSDLTRWLFLELEGVRRLTTRPQGAAVAPENDYAFFTRLTLHY
ncbi:MAG: ShlB/FhaC/HecB family hemolysin secretion/activation protein [Alphaproteobacteria bacterium]